MLCNILSISIMQVYKGIPNVLFTNVPIVRGHFSECLVNISDFRLPHKRKSRGVKPVCQYSSKHLFLDLIED